MLCEMLPQKLSQGMYLPRIETPCFSRLLSFTMLMFRPPNLLRKNARCKRVTDCKGLCQALQSDPNAQFKLVLLLWDRIFEMAQEVRIDVV